MVTGKSTYLHPRIAFVIGKQIGNIKVHGKNPSQGLEKKWISQTFTLPNSEL